MIQWWRKGPITRQLRTFMWSNAPVHYKIGMLSCQWFCSPSRIPGTDANSQICSRTVRLTYLRNFYKRTLSASFPQMPCLVRSCFRR